MMTVLTRARVMHREEAEQTYLMQWAALAQFPALPAGHKVADYLIAIPNGGKRNAREAARLKVQGVKAGVSDLFLAFPVAPFGGLWIELKAPYMAGKAPCKLSKPQLAWLDRMGSAGYGAVCCWGWRNAEETITHYLGGKA